MYFADKEDAQNKTAFRKQFREKYYLAKQNDSAVILEFAFYSTTWQEMNMNMKNGVINRQMTWHTVEAHEMLEFANSREGKR